MTRMTPAQQAEELNRARRQVKKALEMYVTIFAAIFPVKGSIRWRKGLGDHDQVGTVVDHGDASPYGHDRIRVRNIDTGKDYWITAYDVLQALERDR